MSASLAPGSAATPAADANLSPRQVLMVAIACGVIVANLYFAQPLIGLIQHDIHLAPAAAGFIVTLTQVGYGLGLLLIVPLGDLLENRRLIIAALLSSLLALLGLASSQNAASFLAAAFLVGLTCVSAQVLVPYAAQLAPAATRGETVGKVMSGLLLGIMLARPVSSLLAGALGWRAVFVVAAAGVVALAVAIRATLPARTPPARASGPLPSRYASLLASMAGLLRGTPLLRRRAAYHAMMFAAFSLFWTVVPLLLTSPRFGFSQTGVALFALAGVSGAIAAPIAGRAADRGHTRIGTVLALGAGAVSFALPWLVPGWNGVVLALLVAAGILLDMGVSANLVLSQRAIYALGDEHRSRLNGLFMAIFFAGGAVGSALGGWAWAHGGWAWTSALGAVFPLLALGYYLTEPRA